MQQVVDEDSPRSCGGRSGHLRPTCGSEAGAADQASQGRLSVAVHSTGDCSTAGILECAGGELGCQG